MKIDQTDSFLCHDTIIAQCTPQGPGAIALLRLSGRNAVSIASHISKLASGGTLISQNTHTIHYGQVMSHHGTTIDHVLFLLMRAPKTFTGHDTVEITCHNNPLIIDAIIHEAIRYGARLAKPGEFAQQAVMNNKMDVLQAEAVHELIHAHTSSSLSMALGQLEGSFSYWVHEIEQGLLKAQALCEASFEFLDEEMTFDDQITDQINVLTTTIAKLQQSHDGQRHIREGIRIALVGSVNTGKSSLFNALLKRSRAIVSPVAGTTRDVIEASLTRNGTFWTVVDTAGLRETDDVIEHQGIQKTREEAHGSDIVLLVYDASRDLTAQEVEIYQELERMYPAKIIRVRNKIDLADCTAVDDQEVVDVSTKTGVGVEGLFATIESRAEQLIATNQAPFLLNQRHAVIIDSVQERLNTIVTLLKKPIAYEIVSYHLHDALTILSDLTGKSLHEECMDLIFRSFCVGK